MGFIPIGYDFGGSYATGVQRRIDPRGEYGMPQPLVISQNWLSSLFWSDDELNLKIHKRTKEIIEEYTPFELYKEIVEIGAHHFGKDIEQGLYLSEYKSTHHWKDSLLKRDEVRDRIKFLEVGYSNPIAQITPGWQSSVKFQIHVLNRRFYLILNLDNNVCKKNEGKVSVQLSTDRKPTIQNVKMEERC